MAEVEDVECLLDSASGLPSATLDVKPAFPESVTSDALTAHFLAQIKFLHNEVERLEGQLSHVRKASYSDLDARVKHYESVIQQKDAELFQWKKLHGRPNSEESGDLVKRCSVLEKQLATSNSEKSTLLVEKNDLLAKVRKMEVSLKHRKSELDEAQRDVVGEHSSSAAKIQNLMQVIQTLLDERDDLQRRIADAELRLDVAKISVAVGVEADTATTAVQTDVQVKTTEKECQVDTPIHFADPSVQSMHSLSQALEERTQERDDLRARLADMNAVQEDSLRMLSVTKKRLGEEVERRRLVADDAEKLSIQVRSLQQRASEQAATERDLVAKITLLEDQKQQLWVDLSKHEQERHSWEEQMRQYEKDLTQLVANKNHTNQQVSLLANENESLRADVQGLLQRESQLTFSLKAKDGEIQEILSAYQNAARENETISAHHRVLERELDNVRATLASKEEGAIYLQEQLSNLHNREQQLLLDMQTFEYENSQLHRRLAQSETSVAQFEAKCIDFQQLVHSKDQVVEELHQSLTDLSKQIVVKESESLLLRRRCDSLENDAARLHAAVSTEAERCRALEDSNARLVARDVLSTNRDVDALSIELARVKAALGESKVSLSAMEERLRSEVHLREEAQKEKENAVNELHDVAQAKERLQQVVLDQATTLSHLSK